MCPVAMTPSLVVQVDGAPLALEDARALGEVRVQQRLSLPTLCELSFFDPEGPLAEGSAPTPGSSLRVAVETRQVPLFVGEITALEYVYEPDGGRVVRVRGYDLLHRLRKRRALGAHVEVSVSELAHELVADLGISVEAQEPGPLWKRCIRHAESDLDLLCALAGRGGLHFVLRGDVLHLLTLEGIGDEVPLDLGESLLEARMEVNGDPACRSVSVLGWDPWRAERHEARVASARVGRSLSADTSPERFGETGECMLVDETVQDEAQAEAAAQARLNLEAARELTFVGVAEGDPVLRPGTPVRLQGIATSLAGRYVLTSVNHTIDAQKGFVSELSTVPPVPRRRPKGAVSTLGIVTQVDDPENQGRIRVSLPTYGDVETEWLSVLSMGAGADKGLMMLPDVGDSVLVLLLQEDPGQSVVLGGLYGVSGVPDSGVEGGAVRRYSLVTPRGQRLQLDDTGNLVRLENGDGSSIVLSPEEVCIHARCDLKIEAPGRSVVIRGGAVDFQRG